MKKDNVNKLLGEMIQNGYGCDEAADMLAERDVDPKLIAEVLKGIVEYEAQKYGSGFSSDGPNVRFNNQQ